MRTGVWVGDCFIYNNADWRLNYCVGGEVTTIFHLDRPMYLLGYLAAQNRVYLIDKEFGVVSYTLLLSLIEYKTLVLRGEMEAAEELLPSIPRDQHNSVARFLESRGLVADALRIATDPDYKFELAVQLGELGVAREIVETENMAAGENKWKQLGELAMSGGDIELASACLAKSGDLSGQLLLCSATASPARLEELAVTARKKGKNNVAFVCFFLLNKIDDCIELLCETGRVPEAAFMARTYAPSKVSDVVALWKADLAKVNKKAAEALADPLEFKNLFPDFDLALRAEQAVRAKASVPREPASSFPQSKNIGGKDLIEEIKGLTITHGDIDLGASSKASPAPEALVENRPESTPDQEPAAQPAPEPAPETAPQVEQGLEPQVELEPEPQVEQEPEPPTHDSAASPEEDLPDADGDDDDWGLTD